MTAGRFAFFLFLFYRKYARGHCIITSFGIIPCALAFWMLGNKYEIVVLLIQYALYWL